MSNVNNRKEKKTKTKQKSFLKKNYKFIMATLPYYNIKIK